MASETRGVVRRRGHGRGVAFLMLINTLVSRKRVAGSGGELPERAAMRSTERRFRCHDEGLPTIQEKRLLSADVWGVDAVWKGGVAGLM